MVSIRSICIRQPGAHVGGMGRDDAACIAPYATRCDEAAKVCLRSRSSLTADSQPLNNALPQRRFCSGSQDRSGLREASEMKLARRRDYLAG